MIFEKDLTNRIFNKNYIGVIFNYKKLRKNNRIFII